MTDRPEPCCFDEWARWDARRARAGRMVRGISADLVDALERAGLAGRSILDLGCGAGGVTIASVLRGAAVGTGVDVSAVGIEEARSLASASGVGDRTAFSVGDAAEMPLQAHDVVVLNRVFCCYPHVDRLLANSLPLARSVYAYTVPPSAGLRGLLARSWVRLDNVRFRLRPAKYGGFRTYVHDIDAIDREVRRAGFAPIEGRRRVSWDLRVYARA